MPENIDATAPIAPNQAVPAKKQYLKYLNEDWWAVILGGILIAAIVLFKQNGIDIKLPVYKWSGSEELYGKILSAKNLLLIAKTGGVFLLLTVISIALSGGNIGRYIIGFIFIFLLANVAFIIGGNKSIAYYGLEYVVFALLIGLLIGNFMAIPAWLKEAVRSEFFIKTGLVILGTGILSSDLVAAGLPGIIQAVIVVSAVWFFSLWLGRRLKVDDEFGIILASAVSICGVSAAIVAAGAINGDKRKLSYVTTLVLLMAIPMMIIQPWLVRVLHIPEIVGGAWLGGTLDTTATVTAAGAIVGPAAVKAGVIAKFSQNVFIGVAAFLIAIWWAYRKPKGEPKEGGLNLNVGKPGLGIVWERFPKFVLGFIAASLIFSFALDGAAVKSMKPTLDGLRAIWFGLAFVCIGMEAKFSDLVKLDSGRPAYTFVGAQIFNILWTLLWAYILFGGYIFPIPDFK
ncbi:YeiH family protein [Mucilaginibacter myungsuensis]|uniref:Sulfate exporter family transporter n=1 Tax=Mucilaginibacter myungsuensis TaxID=649104 RepID=A0A929KY60_9SPHI|nr:putative sulfate exporter family transporter [Mucilaginibacter myungsuensis]MBE9660780.1 putative sulfate exporter family transporter [Mucilaginibacter myungsuensis]MDN3600825.1 putative sulfate exporter family transporter [Mucilaginibacter myungsuensis]